MASFSTTEQPGWNMYMKHMRRTAAAESTHLPNSRLPFNVGCLLWQLWHLRSRNRLL